MLSNICSHLFKRFKVEGFSPGPVITNYAIDFTNDRIKLSLPKDFISNKKLELDSIKNFKSDNIIQNIEIKSKDFVLEVNKNIFIEDVLKVPNLKEILRYNEKLVVDFSSPNIAKPFHLGNLRSTIIGNFISNLNTYLGNSVTRLNYLGDWGTQFGFLNVGLDILNLQNEELAKDPINLLYKAYVTAHNLSKTNPEIVDKARNIFSDLENGKDLERWKLLKEFTTNELELTYNRLGVKFDHYDWESMYGSQKFQTVVDVLKTNDLLKTDYQGRQIIEFGDRNIPILKSDQSSLYISRDILAAIDRYERFKFDRMLIGHVKFGRVRGMSTRKGSAVFLNDILDEAKDLMLKKQIESSTTKVSINNSEITDSLGISCVIINDLKQRRQRDYEFNWEKVLQVKGDSGSKLQYTHCRLYSLLNNNSNIKLPEKCDPEILSSNIEALNLIIHLSKFYSILHKSHLEMEACILVNYLFILCNLISRALKVLRVKNEQPSIASQRLLLFYISKHVLYDGMVILGLKPLNEM
ncbi:probable arginine--tRNA ligase, mitochondrial isoform X2 [Chrysoperla carnea]|uniref:probable arginine--tRNA ligase, mitochondrial isoform X2 n=1 Tax=Chrysoperla carnea TaxID=189513 RepID=UPI001D05CE47|nr:probable arginine--tRNA ligase, mitochondrial isoform X2 [Chrysoperla carnea]